jgi:hypothetical protein
VYIKRFAIMSAQVARVARHSSSALHMLCISASICWDSRHMFWTSYKAATCAQAIWSMHGIHDSLSSSVSTTTAVSITPEAFVKVLLQSCVPYKHEWLSGLTVLLWVFPMMVQAQLNLSVSTATVPHLRVWYWMRHSFTIQWYVQHANTKTISTVTALA